MTAGHLAVAKELGVKVSKSTAREITEHDKKYSTCIYDNKGGYVVYKTSKSVTGDIHILTKLYIPKYRRGNGYARNLLDRCETPLVTSKILDRVR